MRISGSRWRTTADTLLPRPRPGPIRHTPQADRRAKAASPASRESCPSLPAGRGWGMASSSLAAATGQTGAGTPTVTSPAPERTAAWAASTGAPV